MASSSKSDYKRTLTVNDAKLVGQTEAYTIKLLEFFNEKAKVVWSTCFITLYPQFQSAPFIPEFDMRYEIIEGEATATVDNTPFRVEVGDHFLVLDGQYHWLYNHSLTLDLIYRFDYPGRLKEREPQPPVQT